MGGSDSGANQCTGCGHRILDRYLLCIDGEMWHETCAICTICLQPLEHSCHVRNGKLFCRYDYFRYFGICCLGCNHPIFPQDSVLRLDQFSQLVNDLEEDEQEQEQERFSWTRRQNATTCPVISLRKETHESTDLLYFHQSCFICCKCQRILYPGEPYILRDTMPMCYSDFQKELLIETNTASCTAALATSNDAMLGEPTMLIKHTTSSADLVPTSLESMLDAAKTKEEPDSYELASVATDYPSNSRAGSTDGSSRADRADEEEELFEIDSDSGSGKNSKRPRTILTATQRRRFKSVFEMNPKPARKMREALASETGLNIRVVQVWFQNQRAKVKKLARRQAQEVLQQANRRLFACNALVKDTQTSAPQLMAMNSSNDCTSPVKRNGSTTSFYSFGPPDCADDRSTAPFCAPFVEVPLIKPVRAWAGHGDDSPTAPFVLSHMQGKSVEQANLSLETNTEPDPNPDLGQALSTLRLPQLTPGLSTQTTDSTLGVAPAHNMAIRLFPAVPLLTGPFTTNAMLPCFDQLHHGPPNTIVTDLTLPSPPMDKLYSMQQSYFLSN